MNDKRKRCAVPGCKAPMHARGYCRRHYSQLWRGRRSSSSESKKTPRREHIHDDPERIRALERELKKAEHMYEVVVGFEGRVKWRREMEAVRTELRRLGIEPPPSTAGKAKAGSSTASSSAGSGSTGGGSGGGGSGGRARSLVKRAHAARAGGALSD